MGATDFENARPVHILYAICYRAPYRQHDSAMCVGCRGGGLRNMHEIRQDAKITPPIFVGCAERQ